MALKVGVAGAAGLLGTELLRVFEDQAFPVDTLVPLAEPEEIEAAKAEHRVIDFLEDELDLVPATAEAFDGCDLVFLAGTPEQSARLAKISFLRVPITIDLSGHFANVEDVPLVLTEIDDAALGSLPPRCLIAVPDAATAMVALALAPLHREAGIKHAFVSTYEAASGLGRAGMDELGQQVKALFNYQPADAQLFPKPLAFNCLPQVDAFEANGYTRSEMAMARGVARVLKGVAVTATRAWVPVFSGHSASIVVETGRPLSADAARTILESAPGIDVVDAPDEGEYPVNGDTVGQDQVLVGRLRETGDGRLAMWIAADNVRRGAALSAVHVAKAVLERRSKLS